MHYEGCKMKSLRIFGASIVLSICGCGTTGAVIRADYVQADRATYEAIAPEYLRYVQADSALDAEERIRRERTLTTWRLRLEQAEKPVEVTTND